jgi:ADP-heptose:LPS heptosyltransferase
MPAATAANPPSSILVYVGLDLMGDALMKMPFVRALRETYPRARITWLAGKGKTVFRGPLAPLVKGLIDEVIEDAGIGSRWTELLRRPLAGRHFDLVIDTQRRVPTTLILRRLRCDMFISGAADFAFSSVRPPRGYRKPATMIRQMLDLIELASGARVEERIAPLYDRESYAQAAALLPDGAVYVGLVPGAGGRHKCWPRERFVEIGRRQVRAGRVPVVILGPDESLWYEEVRAALPEARFPLQEESARDAGPLLTIALAARMAAAVSNDSGGGHLVAAGGVPLVSLWGPTVMEKAPPQTPTLITVLARDFGSTAMEAIPVDAVHAAAETLLTGNPVAATKGTVLPA